MHTSGYRLLSFSGVTSTPLLATVAAHVMASTSFISENTFAAAEATAMTYTVFTSLYTTRYLPSRVLMKTQGRGKEHKGAAAMQDSCDASRQKLLTCLQAKARRRRLQHNYGSEEMQIIAIRSSNSLTECESIVRIAVAAT